MEGSLLDAYLQMGGAHRASLCLLTLSSDIFRRSA